MNFLHRIQTVGLASMLALSLVAVPTVVAHAEPNNEGIEMDCPLGGNWVANGGYVIAKDAQGNYHRVYCVDGRWVDGGVITGYRTAPPAARPAAGLAALP
jgi:hypothetical protein